MKKHILAIAILTCLLMPLGALADDGWKFGIGTGISLLDVDGDAGFNTPVGPVLFDASMTSDEVREYTESAFGFGGFAKKGDWTITYSIFQMDMEDTLSAEQGGNTGDLTVTFTATGAEVLTKYRFSKTAKNSWEAIGGLRYTGQEYGAELEINNVTVFDGSVDDNWLDLVVGISNIYVISPTLLWTSQLDYGLGGSEGTIHFNTGVSKILNKSWMIRGAVDVKDIEYEEGNPGDSDWFYYKATESTAGFSFMYMF